MSKLLETRLPTEVESSVTKETFNRLTRIDDADAYTNTAEVPFRFYPCLTAGLAYYLSMKRNPQLMGALKTIYEEELQRALDEDRDRASLRISPSYETYRS